ncbi:transcriptional activator of glycolytic enzymes-domain-containing protein [Xylaria venustula]|nr:transcriptional activator of glycolytic enzymes-domain-containing protein [Xylaria venustula]
MPPQPFSASQVTSSSSSISNGSAPPSTVPASTTAPIPIPIAAAATTTPVAAAPTSTPTPTTTSPTFPTSTATPTPGPAAAPTGAATLKRPAASDLQRSAGRSAGPPSKRQATASAVRGLSSAVATPTQIPAQTPASAEPSLYETPFLQSRMLRRFQPSPATSTMPGNAPIAPGLITEDQLHDRTPEQLIVTILQLQNQHQHLLAQINAQFESISQQLIDLRSGLAASHQAAASALLSRDQQVRSIIPPPLPPTAPLQQTAVPPPPRPPTHTPTRATPRVPPASPGHQIAPRSSLSTATPAPAGPPQFEYRTVGTVEEVWKEYREGLGGQMAIEKLDSMWGSRWRPEPRGRTWYSRRKVIWDKIREFINEGMDEAAAVQEVEKLRDGGTINKLIRMLQDERKDKGSGDENTA